MCLHVCVPDAHSAQGLLTEGRSLDCYWHGHGPPSPAVQLQHMGEHRSHFQNALAWLPLLGEPPLESLVDAESHTFACAPVLPHGVLSALELELGDFCHVDGVCTVGMGVWHKLGLLNWAISRVAPQREAIVFCSVSEGACPGKAGSALSLYS